MADMHSHPSHRFLRAAGMGLVELMVATTIGIFLIGGALTVYTQSRATYEVNESLSRMQESLRFAFGYIEPDLRLANYWGWHNSAISVDRRAGTLNPLTNTTAVANDCAPAWSIDLDRPTQAFDSVHPGWACLPVANLKPNTDILVVRHAAEAAIATADLQPGVIYIRSDEKPSGILFAGAEPGSFSPEAENHELVTHAYYIRPYSYVLPDGTQDNIPSLRRLALVDGGANPAIIDQEVISGVEDLQIQFGVDTSLIGAPISGTEPPGSGSANLYVDADNAILANPDTRIVAMRVWILIRAERIDPGYEDNSQYVYADQSYTIDGRDDMPQGFRRMLVGRTIEMRNL